MDVKDERVMKIVDECFEEKDAIIKQLWDEKKKLVRRVNQLICDNKQLQTDVALLGMNRNSAAFSIKTFEHKAIQVSLEIDNKPDAFSVKLNGEPNCQPLPLSSSHDVNVNASTSKLRDDQHAISSQCKRKLEPSLEVSSGEKILKTSQGNVERKDDDEDDEDVVIIDVYSSKIVKHEVNGEL